MSGIKISELASHKQEKLTQGERRRRTHINLSELSEAYRKTKDSSNQSESESITSGIVATNQQQTDNKPETDRQQSDNKVTTKRQQTNNIERSSNTSQSKTDNKLGAKPATKVEAKWQQTDNKVATQVIFSSLVGLQRNAILIIYKSCKSSRSKSTEALTLQHIADLLKTSSGSVKTTLQRLEKKGCINRVEFKNGRGGWSKYELSEELFRDLLQQETENKLTTNWQQSDNKVGAKPATELATSPSSSNSSNIINTNTTSEEDDTWLQEVQLPNNLKNLGFGVSHLKQLKNKFSLSSEEIQKGLEAFSYDLDKGEGDRLKARGVQNLIGFFFGAMKSGGYNPVNEGFQTAEDAAEQEMLNRLKRRQHERESRKKELRELFFKEWLETKDEKELAEIAPPPLRHMDSLHIVALQDYFYSNEFDKFKMELE